MLTKKRNLIVLFIALLNFIFAASAFAEDFDSDPLEDYTVTYTSNDDGLFITNSRSIETVDITAQKIWDDADNQDGIRPSEIILQLKSDGDDNGSPVTIQPDNNGEWTYTWSGLPKNRDQGVPIEYTVVEVSETDGYTASVDDDGVTVRNKHDPETYELEVQWSWEDDNDRDGVRPDSAVIDVLLGEEKYGEITVDQSDTASKTITVPKYTPGKVGEIATYTARASQLDPKYSSADSSASYGEIAKMEGVYAPQKTTVSVSKEWDDNNNQDGKRPSSVSYVLVTDTAAGDTVTVTAAESDNFSYTWNGLFKYRDHGTLINYSVEEINPGEYTPSYDCTENEEGSVCVVKNTYDPENQNLQLTWNWDDDNNRDGKRQDTVTVEVFIGDTPVGTVEFSKNDDTSNKTISVPKYVPGEEGVEAEYRYVITDLNTDYSGSTDTSNKLEPVFTASYTSELVSVQISKLWEDNGNQDGARPAQVSYILVTDNVKGEPVTTTNADYSYTWEGLYKYHDGGIAYSYSVEEIAADGYTPSYSCSNTLSGVACQITNRYNVTTKDISVTWVWDDDSDRDGVRQDSVTVDVYLNNEVVATVTFDKNDNTSVKTITIPAYTPGEEGVPSVPTYVIKDLQSPYEGRIDESNVDAPVLEGTYDPVKITVDVVKEWDDADNHDGKRPETITWQLFKDGDPEGDPVTLSISGSNYSWENLHLYHDQGQKYQYSVKEVNVAEGYSASEDYEQDGNNIHYTVTNTHSTETVSFTPRIVWDDDDNRDGIRPETLTIRITADGKPTEYTFEINDEEGWKHLFENLPKYNDGEEVNYTFEVVDTVDGYTYEFDPEDEWTLVYTHEPEKTTFSATIKWEDDDNVDQTRPESVSVQLYANGEPVGDPQDVTEDDDWTIEMPDLFRYNEGEEIVYTIRMVDNLEPDYTTETEDTENSTTITNYHGRDTKSVPFVVVWDDESNQDGKRPNVLDLVIFEEDEEIRKEGFRTDEDVVEEKFEGMPANRDGEPIKYRIDLDKVPEGYTVEIVERPDGTPVITLTYKPADLVTKSIWDEKGGKWSNEVCVNWDIVTIRLSVVNNGINTLYNVTVRDRLPKDAAFVLGSEEMTVFNEETGDTLTVYDGRIDVNIGVLEPGEKRVITYKAKALDPRSFADIPGSFDYGNENPLPYYAPDPERKTNTVDPCRFGDKPAPQSTPDELPKTGFAPGVYTKLPPMSVNYQSYSELRIRIPRLGVDAEILGVPYENGDWDVTWLGSNVGWLQNTAYPGTTGAGNTVLTGHLTNNFGQPGVFSDLGTLTYGDQIIITAFGETYTYIVDDMTTVYHDTPQVLSQKTEIPILTLITCKFYNEASGTYDGRVVVTAKLSSIR